MSNKNKSKIIFNKEETFKDSELYSKDGLFDNMNSIFQTMTIID